MGNGTPAVAKQKMTFMERIKETGPGAVMAGAWWPGSITVLSIVGAQHQYALLWMLIPLLFFHYSQYDMCARLALGGGKTFRRQLWRI